MLRKCSLDQLRQTEGVEELHRKKQLVLLECIFSRFRFGVWVRSSEASVNEPRRARENSNDGMMTERLLTKCQQKNTVSQSTRRGKKKFDEERNFVRSKSETGYPLEEAHIKHNFWKFLNNRVRAEKPCLETFATDCKEKYSTWLPIVNLTRKIVSMISNSQPLINSMNSNNLKCTLQVKFSNSPNGRKPMVILSKFQIVGKIWNFTI